VGKDKDGTTLELTTEVLQGEKKNHYAEGMEAIFQIPKRVTTTRGSKAISTSGRQASNPGHGFLFR